VLQAASVIDGEDGSVTAVQSPTPRIRLIALREVLGQPMVRHFRYWHFSDTTFVPVDVRLWGHSGKHLLAAGISHFDPQPTPAIDPERAGGDGKRPD